MIILCTLVVACTCARACELAQGFVRTVYIIIVVVALGKNCIPYVIKAALQVRQLGGNQVHGADGETAHTCVL